MSNVMKIMMYMSFFSTFAAESPEESPFITRGKNLGDTGAVKVPSTPKPRRLVKNSSTGFSEDFLRSENLRVSPRDGQIKPGFINNHKYTPPREYKPKRASDLSNPPAKK